jgi:predicted acyl esterase
MKTSFTRFVSFVAPALLLIASAGTAEESPRVTPMTPDVVDKYEQTLPAADFTRREVMVPMRDGTKLYTVVVMKKGTDKSPILLSRTRAQSCCHARLMTRMKRPTVSRASGSSTSWK